MFKGVVVAAVTLTALSPLTSAELNFDVRKNFNLKDAIADSQPEIPVPVAQAGAVAAWKNTPLFKILKANPDKIIRTVTTRSNPEFAYESLIGAPVWKSETSAPESVDLSAGFSPVRRQGGRNTCSVFATSALAEYLIWKKYGEKLDLSEEFLFYNAKWNFTDKPELQAYKEDWGLAGYVAVDALRCGVVLEKEWPYNPDWMASHPVSPVTDREVGIPPEGVKDKIIGYKLTPVAIRRNQIKDFLAKERRPVVMNLLAYRGRSGNYMEVIDEATGRISDPSESERNQCATFGTSCGGHVVLITGYDPQLNEYVFRNSWGADWGVKGYGRISEKYLMENCEACYLPKKLEEMDLSGKSMEVNTAYGWSALLERYYPAKHAALNSR